MTKAKRTTKAKAKKTTKAKTKSKVTPKVKEDVTLRVEDYLKLDEGPVLEKSIEEQLEDKWNEKAPNIEKKIQEHVKFMIAREKHVENLNSADVSISKAELKLLGEKDYTIASSVDGLLISEKEEQITLFNINKGGSAGFGTRSPKVYGPGSVHIRSNYPSEAPIPSTGLNSTRGLLVESDSDDEKTFAFRVLSRQNRQGFNLTGDGKLIWGLINDNTKSKLLVNQIKNDENLATLHASSRYYTSNILDLSSKSESGYSFISAKSNVENYDTRGVGTEVYKVDGQGNSYIDGEYFANGSGYTELFQWEDKNPKNENRNGFTVTFNTKGEIRLATEDNKIIGVAVAKGAVVGNSYWNEWHSKFEKDSFDAVSKHKYKVVEWQDEVGMLHSYFEDGLPADFALPESAVIYETDDLGDDMYKKLYNDTWEFHQSYIQRTHRGWVRVAFLGQIALYKGQITNPNWIKIRDLNDEVELWLIK